MSDAYFGPISLVIHGNPSYSWVADPTSAGLRAATFAGLLEWDQAKQMQELVDNPARRITIGTVSGVLEPVWPDGDVYADFRGMYLLQQCLLNPQQADTLSLCPFTLTATLVAGDALRQVIATRSARARDNDYSLSPTGLAPLPFFHEDVDGGSFLADPGGTRFTREYDSSSPHDTARLTPAGDDARSLAIYAGAADPDELSPLLYPVLAPGDAGGIPAWVTNRGGDCRAYDRRSMREVYGPSHPYQTATDCIVLNGLLSARVGNRGLPAYLHVQAFAGGTWREVGCLRFADRDVLLGHRVTKVAPDVTILALAIKDKGDVFVTLKRGERMLRIDLPTSMSTPWWSGLPPTSRAIAAWNFIGRFGNGLDGGGSSAESTWVAPFPTWTGDARFSWAGTRRVPDVRFRWPAERTPVEWSKLFRYRPDVAASAFVDNAGFLTLYGPNGQAIVELYLDAADKCLKVRVLDAIKLTSAPQSFTASADVLLGVRFSATQGLTLSVWDGSGAAHVADLTTTDLGVASLYEFTYATNFNRFGDGTFGDGVFGGTTSYPDGVIDNAMIFDRWLTDTEFETLGAAVHALDGLPDPEGSLIWYGPFDTDPLPVVGAESSGRTLVGDVDDNGLQRALAYLDTGHKTMAALLATTASQDTVVDHHNQLAAASEQSVRVR